VRLAVATAIVVALTASVAAQAVPSPVATGVATDCHYTVSIDKPASLTGGGWGVQFYADGVAFGTRDASTPYTRSKDLPLAAHVFHAVWSKGGVPSVTTGSVLYAATCPPTIAPTEEPPPPPVTGGFVEDTISTAVRPLLSASQIAAFVPTRGRFTFPAPYLTEGVRLTNASDCNGTDCVLSVGYAYWRNINNHAGNPTLLAFLTLDGQGGPTLFSYDKASGVVKNLGAIFASTHRLAGATGEGWYFSASQPNALYVFDRAQLIRVDVITRAQTVVFDAAVSFGANRLIWQAHSSHDDTVHSFTLRDGSTYEDLGCGVYSEVSKTVRFFPAVGDYDECQIDKGGRFLVVKDNVDGVNGEDNVVYDLSMPGAKQTILDPDGAGGHSDAGFGYEVAEDNWHAKPGAVRVWTFGGGEAPTGRLVYHATSWNLRDSHIAHANAKAGVPLGQQYACSSNANAVNVPRSNEIVCYRLDGSLKALVVAPVMTDLAAAGGATYYDKLPKGNIDVTGEWFIWTSNLGGARLDAFLVRIPVATLGLVP
jgi:hypothetical protein